MSDTVWIGFFDFGREGCSEPKVVFATKALAEVWKANNQEAKDRDAEIIEIPVTAAPKD